jgi:hypothetical protein
MEAIIPSSKPTTESEPKPDSFDSVWKYSQELRAENQKLKTRLAFLEHEITLLLPAAHFLRTRDALHKTMRRYVTLAEACRAYRKKPSTDRIRNILAALKAVESVETT